jgi:hypothetical protein
MFSYILGIGKFASQEMILLLEMAYILCGFWNVLEDTILAWAVLLFSISEPDSCVK